MMSPAEFAAKLSEGIALIEPGLLEGTKATMEHAKSKAQEAIGTYEFGWPPLAEATKADRVRTGFPEDEPLLRTGGLKGSIETMAEAAPGGAEGLIYSGEKKALWAELGTRTQPPRSFLFQGLLRSIPEMAATFARVAERVLTA